MSEIVAPAVGKAGFHCPRCHVYENQVWFDLYIHPSGFSKVEGAKVALCSHCEKKTHWLGESLLYPPASLVQAPNIDLSPEVKADYEEAASILSKSPRGAAALLRLAIQKLVIDLGCKGKDLNADIAKLVSKGLPQKIQKALDLVRVIGNNAVHPGTIDFSDDGQIARQLFGLVNLIADVMISQPLKVEAMYGQLPAGARTAIEKRDGKTI